MNHRLRRLRLTPAAREMFQENHVQPAQLVAPMFVTPAPSGRTPIESLPGIDRLGTADAADEAGRAWDAGIRSVLLFGIPQSKDPRGDCAAAADGPTQAAVRSIRQRVPGMVIFTDVCLCSFTTHGHCGIPGADGLPDNDATVAQLARVAASHADAGADFVAPSDMMDGRVAAIRAALDAAGHQRTGIMSYAAKFASAFYGPFRDAADSTPESGDRRSHQLNPANRNEALACVDRDLAEGADIVMVKPALAYLDIIAAVRQRTTAPVAAYMVSGEYAMLRAAADRGWLDWPRAALEALLSIRRAGAGLIITYLAADIARGDLKL